MEYLEAELGEARLIPGPGRGIDSMQVDADNHLQITYTDDTTEDAGVVAKGRVLYRGNTKGTPADGTASVPEGWPGTTHKFSMAGTLPDGATLVGVYVTCGDSAVVVLATVYSTANMEATIRAAATASGKTFSQLNVYPLYWMS